MTRNDIKALFPEATKEAIDQLLDINSTDIGKAVNKAQGTQDQLEGRVKSLNDQVNSLTEQVKALTGDVTEKDKAIKALTDDKDKTIKDLNAQLKTAQDKATTADALTERVAQLTKDIADRDATIASNTKQYKIMGELRARKAKNPDVVWKMLDVDKITETDGKYEGLDEQLDALQKSDAYLFDVNTGNQRGGFPGVQETGGNVDANTAMNDAIRAAAGRAR